MRSYIVSLLLFLLFLLGGEIASPSPRAVALIPAGSTEMPFKIVEGTFAVWKGGALVFVQGRYSNAPILGFFDRNGSRVSEFRFSIPGATLINLYDNSVALGSDGSLAIVGTAYSDDSRGTMFIAWVSPDRQQQTIIRSSPFFPAAVTIASDGTIWVAGHETSQQPKERDYNQHLIRRYDKTGILLGSFIPWSSLDPPNLPYPGSVLLTLKDRVLWYSARSRAYIEFSADGSIIKRLKSAPHPEHDVSRVAVCDDGSLFASTMIRSQEHPTQWGIFALDPQRSEWTLIPREQKGSLLGCDGTRLAITTDYQTISWLQSTAQ